MPGVEPRRISVGTDPRQVYPDLHVRDLRGRRVAGNAGPPRETITKTRLRTHGTPLIEPHGVLLKTLQRYPQHPSDAAEKAAAPLDRPSECRVGSIRIPRRQRADALMQRARTRRRRGWKGV